MKNETVKGINLERQSHKLDLCRSINHKCYLSNNNKNIKPANINYYVTKEISFDKIRFEEGKMIENSETILLNPTSSNFAYIDYIIFDPKLNLVIFKQLTLLKISDHMKVKDMENIPSEFKKKAQLYKLLVKKGRVWSNENILIEPKNIIEPDKTRTLAEGILEMIFGEKGFKSDIINEEIIFKNPKGEIMNNIFILYGSAKTKSENENSIKKLNIKNIKYFNIEEMVDMGFIFDEKKKYKCPIKRKKSFLNIKKK
jgi:hypothetical protein